MTDAQDRDPQAVVTVLTTEHFALQGGRGATISESSARAALFVGAVSSGLVTLGFVGRGGDDTDTFNGFALVILPTLYAIGVFTFARLVQNSIEDTSSSGGRSTASASTTPASSARTPAT